MKTAFAKYHALGNNFLVIEGKQSPSKGPIGRFARAICDRRTGVGADGILYLSPSRKADTRADVFNSDGSWAEKSGNGVRIVGLHLQKSHGRKTRMTVEMGGSTNEVRLVKKIAGGYVIRAAIDKPDFRAASVPMRSRFSHHVNRPLTIGGETFRATCLSVGNPHCVVLVEDFKFDWQTAGRQIETSKVFPQHTNVEFVQVVNKHTIRVAEWERGAGATGSSGTGAAASVAATVIQGLVDRTCEVKFEPGSLFVEWNSESDCIELSGPVVFVASGEFEYR